MICFHRCQILFILLFAQAYSRAPESPIEVTRVAPDDVGLRGSPGGAVSVTIAIENHSSSPVELSPIRMSCSCQVTKAHELKVPPGQKTEATVTLHYPAFGREETPIVVRDRSSQVLNRINIVLEADQTPPFFVKCPEVVEIPHIQGTVDRGWNSSVITFEDGGSLPFVKEINVSEGVELLTVRMDSEFVPEPNSTTGRRVYRLHFQLTDRALEALISHPVLRGMVRLILHDGTTRDIDWVAKSTLPIALFVDRSRGTVTGVRRSGAQGKVEIRLIPEDSGQLIPNRFDAGDRISSNIVLSGESNPREIVTIFQGSGAPVESVTAVP